MYARIIKLLNTLNRYRQKHISNRNFLIIASVIVGIFGGLAAALLKSLTHHIEAFLLDDFNWPYKYYLYFFFPLTGILLTVVYVKKFNRKSVFESGLTHILYAISKKSSNMKLHNVYSQIISSALTVGFGGSTGLEAPIVSSGSAIGSNLGRFFGLNYREVTVLLACGAASGIAGAFNSPVAGIVFAIEILLPEFSIPVFIPLLISAATASVIARIFYNEQLFFLVTEGWETDALLFYVLLAVIIGFFSIYFTKLTYFIKGWFKKINNPYQRAIAGGLILGALIFLFPALYGEGYVTIKQLLDGNYNSLLQNSIFSAYSNIPGLIIAFTLLTVFAKSAATLITISAGGNGGVFGPSLVMGGISGFLFAFCINQTGLVELNTQNFIVAGMAGALSGIMHAPLTGIFLIAEITGGYMLMVPLMIVSAVSYFINRAKHRYSIYTKPLADKGELLLHEDKDKSVLNMMKLKYLVEKDFVVLHPDKSIESYRAEIIRSKRNIYPVIDDNGKLAGIVYMEQVINVLLNNESSGLSVSRYMEQPVNVFKITDPMQLIMSKMEHENVWILPVLYENDQFAGFVSKSGIFNKYRSMLIRQGNYLQ